jgi:hypothetical protein
MAQKKIGTTVLVASATESLPLGSHIGVMSSVFTVPDIGEKGENYMKSKFKYTDEPMGKLKVISDFLPPPDQLVLKEENVKVTIALKKSSVEFFKREADKHHTSYQKMIRELVDRYSSHHQKSA